MDLVWNLFAFLIGMVCAFVLMLLLVGNKVNLLHEKMMEQKVTDDVDRFITVEKVDGTFLVHDAESDEFVCQVSTFEEMQKKLYTIDPHASWLLTGDTTAMDELRRRSNVERI